MLAESGVPAEIADTKGQPERALGRGDLGDALEAAGGFHQRDDRDIGQPFRRFDDVVDRLDHRQHHPADRGPGQHVQVVGPELGAEPVDPDPVVVTGSEPAQHVLPGRGLALRGHRVLDIQHHDVGAGARSRGELVILRPVDQQPAAGQYRVDPVARVLDIGGGV